MFSLKKLLGKDDKFFDLLEAGAVEAKTSINLLARFLQSLQTGCSPANLDEFILSRRKEKQIRQDMVEALGRTFITPLEREDIEELSVALYRIPKAVEKIVNRLSIYPVRLPADAFNRQAELLNLCAEAIIFMVGQLKGGTHIDKIREANARLQFAEGEADKVMLEQLRALYHGPYDAKEIVFLQELYELVERAVDRCRNVGNIVVQIALKNA